METNFFFFKIKGGKEKIWRLDVLPKRHMLSVYFILSLVFVLIIVLVCHFPFLSLRLFLFC